MVDVTAELERIESAAAMARSHEEQASEWRSEVHAAVTAALLAGASKSAIARAAGVSRQRVQQLAERLAGNDGPKPATPTTGKDTR